MELKDQLQKALGDRYRVGDEILGAEGRPEGGMSRVFKGEDLRLHKKVAIKVASEKATEAAGGVEQFIDEIKLSAKLNHPFLLSVIDHGQVGSQPYYMMEYIEGESLKERLKREPKMPAKEVLQITRNIADALHYVHEENVVHRDVKPGNILLSRGFAYLTDFGIARAEQRETMPEPRGHAGTLAYMSPEQSDGKKVDRRSDIFSLACVVYEMVARQTRHSGPPVENVMGRARGRVMRRAWSQNPAERQATATAFYEELAAAKNGVPRWAMAMGMVVAIAVLAYAIVPPFRNTVDRWRGVGERPIRSIAVLPPSNFAGNPDSVLSNAIAARLTSNLTGIAALDKVISHQAMLRYKNTEKSIREIAKELEVEVLLAGTVQRSGGLISFDFELIDGQSEQALMSWPFESRSSDIFNLTRRVVTAVVKRLNVPVSPQEKTVIEAVPEVDSTALFAYQRATFYYDRDSSREGFYKALDQYQLATEADPSFALAFAGLSNCYRQLADWGYMTSSEARPKALSAAMRAVALDDQLPEAYLARAQALKFQWDWQRWLADVERAIELQHNNAWARHQLSEWLLCQGRHEEDIVQAKRARDLNPDEYLTLILGGHLLWGRRNDEALVWFEYLRDEMKSDYGLWGVAETQRTMGNHAAAIQGFSELLEKQPDDSMHLGHLAYTYAEVGRVEEAEAILERMKAMDDPLHYFIGLVHAGLGQDEEAIDWLEAGVDNEGGWVPYLKVDPRLKRLHSNPRYQALMRRINLVS